MWIYFVCAQFVLASFCYDFDSRNEAVDKYFECIQSNGKDVSIDSVYIEEADNEK